MGADITIHHIIILEGGGGGSSNITREKHGFCAYVQYCGCWYYQSNRDIWMERVLVSIQIEEVRSHDRRERMHIWTGPLVRVLLASCALELEEGEEQAL